MSTRHTYSVEVLFAGKWCAVVSNATRGVCDGYMLKVRDGWTPRLAHRMISSGGKLHDELEAVTEVRVGATAGSPTGADYRAAAARALAKADVLDRIDAERKNRRGL